MDVTQFLQETGFDPEAQLERMTSRLDGFEQRLSAVTGTGLSDDGLIEAVVGAHGDLRDLVIDPRVYREPDSAGLAAAILQATAEAAEQAGAEVTRISQKVFGELAP